MPYIAITTTQKLSASLKETIKTELGRLITIIPTKTEQNLLINFSDSNGLYKSGKEVDGAFIEIRLLRKADFEPKKKLTEEVFELLSRELGLQKENIYLNMLEFEEWGSNGTLRS